MKNEPIDSTGLQKAVDEVIEEYKTLCVGLKHFTATELRVKLLPGIGYSADFSLSATGFTKASATPHNRLTLLSRW